MSSPRAAAPAPHRLLVFDDEDAILSLIRAYLTHRGYQVDCAHEMEEAEALLATTQYSVAVLDLAFTGENVMLGLELIRYVRERFPWTQIVVLAAYGPPEVEEMARRRGAHAFLHKPMHLSELSRTISELLKSRW